MSIPFSRIKAPTSARQAYPPCPESNNITVYENWQKECIEIRNGLLRINEEPQPEWNKARWAQWADDCRHPMFDVPVPPLPFSKRHNLCREQANQVPPYPIAPKPRVVKGVY